MLETPNPTQNHPNDSTLRDFAAGLLVGLVKADVAAHVEACERCRNLLKNVIPGEVTRSSNSSSRIYDTVVPVPLPSKPFDESANAKVNASLDSTQVWSPLSAAPDVTLDALQHSPDPFATIAPAFVMSPEDKEALAICEKFRSDSRGAKAPTIEDYLPDHITGVNRSKLLERLVILEISMLREKRETVDTSKYLARFSHFEDAIRSAIRALDSHPIEATMAFQGTPSSGSDATIRSGGSSSSEQCRFHPIKLHAKGGLGAVFLARDAELGRTVALKEIQSRHSLDRSSQDRFITEAIVTGALEHPGIVPVYGLGRYRDGRPYYAMRFIKGSSFQEAITKFHKTHPNKEASTYYSREFKSLLRTFIELCSAMYYAHEHGILHRDIKPDNVMLGRFGETMVVDWGLAKVLNSIHASSRQEFDNLALRKLDGDTMVGVVLGTPVYMSPEQAQGMQDELTPTSDIYSLGATLFTLLTGKRSVEGKSSIEVVLNVRKGNVRRINTITPHAPAALASICYKAMSLKPTDRYRNAGELIEDIERWLADELVLAHRHVERPIERLGRLVRRYHTWAVAGAIFLTAFTALSIAAIVLIERSRAREVVAKLQAQESKAEAIKRYQQSRNAIDTWLVGSNDTLQFYPGTQSLRKRLLQLAVDDYKNLASSNSNDPDLEIERSRAFMRLGDIYQLQQQYDDAHQNYQAARDALTSIGPTLSLDHQRETELANSYVRSGVCYFQQDKLDEADADFTKAITALETLRKSKPEDELILSYFDAALVGFGELLLRQGSHDRVIVTLEPCVKESLQPKVDQGIASVSMLAKFRASELLGRAYTALGKYDKADETILNALTVMATSQIEQSDNPDLLNAAASMHVSRADVLRVQGRQNETEQSLLKAAGQYQMLLTAMPDSPRYAENLALTLTDLGLAMQDDGRSGKAMATLKQAAQHWQELLALYAEVPRYHEQSAACEDALSQVVLDATNDAVEAFEHASSAVQTYQELVELDPEVPSYRHRLAVSRSHAAVILHQLGRNDDAVLVFESAETNLRSLAEQFPAIPSYRHALAHVLERVGSFLLDIERPEESQGKFEEAMKLWTALADEGNSESSNDLAIAYLTCPFAKLRDVASAIKFSEIAHVASLKNAKYKATYAVALATAGESTDKARTLLDEIKEAQGEWTARELFALAILSSKTQAGEADLWLSQGEEWQRTHQPGSQAIKRLRDLAAEQTNQVASGF